MLFNCQIVTINNSVMKKLFYQLIILVSAITLMVSCKKDLPAAAQAESITKVLSQNESFEYDLGSFGFEEGATIFRQASHYSISTTDRSIVNGRVFYYYTPALNYTGTDEVLIRSERGSNGASVNDKFIYTTIKFIINN